MQKNVLFTVLVVMEIVPSFDVKLLIVSMYHCELLFCIIFKSYHLTNKISPSGSSSSHSTFCIRSSGGCWPTISVLVTTFPPDRCTTILWDSPSTRSLLSHVVITLGSPSFDSECLSKLPFVLRSISLSVLQSSCQV